MATLEGGEAAFATASGMAAVHAALLAAGVRSGSAVVAAQDCYGATYSLLNTLMAEQGVAVAFVDMTDLTQVQAALAQHRPAALLVETISNPLLKLADIAALAEIARQHLCHALPVPAVIPGRGLRRPFGQQVHRWPRRRAGRRGGDVAGQPAAAVHAGKAPRRGAGAARCWRRRWPGWR